ncbi:carbon-nitrogen hydrolase family protein [Polaromonas sp.]|uniref:carbon-nitrogen hydrolase family protein n=1 Tax=Polaromonas sp. TaxID=1869339 RepID=UPI00286A1270|nr:carbon-nitrogen hydrolase family protein [Polaromonas sp.]
MKVAAIQMVSGVSVQANLEAAAQWLRSAADQGAELALLPEYFCVMGLKDTDKLALQETPGQGPIQDFLSRSARELGLWIVGGTLPLATHDARRARNSSLAYAPSGECVARYDKMHLFRFAQGQEDYDETRVLAPGTQPVRFALPSRDGHVYTVGMSVCYDLRFPELYRALRADLLLVPSAFTYTTGQAHWEVLLRARAIENLAYVLAAAQGGVHENGRRTWGHSMGVDPWGQLLGQRAEGAGLVMAELSASHLQSVRARLPALGHRVL